ncbi:MAG: hypothetical protein LBC39_02630 [Methanobrevibacter sp.]|jgi:hypothetical protein|nr:hypothetical protein [Candidatus Methanovirga aequatorialis]
MNNLNLIDTFDYDLYPWGSSLGNVKIQANLYDLSEINDDLLLKELKITLNVLTGMDHGMWGGNLLNIDNRFKPQDYNNPSIILPSWTIASNVPSPSYSNSNSLLIYTNSNKELYIILTCYNSVIASGRYNFYFKYI